MHKGTHGQLRAQDPECGRERGPLCGSLCRNNEGKEALMAEPVSNKGKFIQRFPEEPQCLLVLKQKHHVPACGSPLTDAGGWRDPARGGGGGGRPGGRSCRGGAICRVPPHTLLFPAFRLRWVGTLTSRSVWSPALVLQRLSTKPWNHASRGTPILVGPLLQHPPWPPVVFRVKSCHAPTLGPVPRGPAAPQGCVWAPGPGLLGPCGLE